MGKKGKGVSVLVKRSVMRYHNNTKLLTYTKTRNVTVSLLCFSFFLWSSPPSYHSPYTDKAALHNYVSFSCFGGRVGVYVQVC